VISVLLTWKLGGDYQISCSYNLDLSFPHIIAPFVRYPPFRSTPLLYSLVRFTSVTEKLKIAKEAAMILDDMRFLTMAVLKQVDVLPREEERIKLSITSTWIQARISLLQTALTPHLPFLATISINPAELQLSRHRLPTASSPSLRTPRLQPTLGVDVARNPQTQDAYPGNVRADHPIRDSSSTR